MAFCRLTLFRWRLTLMPNHDCLQVIYSTMLPTHLWRLSPTNQKKCVKNLRMLAET